MDVAVETVGRHDVACAALPLAACSRGPRTSPAASLDFGAAGAEVEEILAGEAEHAGEQRRRELLDAGVVFLDRVVEEAAAGGDLVFEVGEFAGSCWKLALALRSG